LPESENIVSLIDGQHSGIVSGVVTPSSGRDHSVWLADIDNRSTKHDPEIIAHFLDMFHSNISPDFTTFQSFTLSSSSLPAVVLAMAAVGGLYFKSPGSFEIAATLYNHARRMAYSLVRHLRVSPESRTKVPNKVSRSIPKRS